MWLQKHTHNSLLEQQLVSCPTRSAPSVSCVIGTEQDVSVDDSRHVPSAPDRQESTADKNLVDPILPGIQINYISGITLSLPLSLTIKSNLWLALYVFVLLHFDLLLSLGVLTSPERAFQQSFVHDFWQATARDQTWYNGYRSMKKFLDPALIPTVQIASGYLCLYSFQKLQMDW